MLWQGRALRGVAARGAERTRWYGGTAAHHADGQSRSYSAQEISVRLYVLSYIRILLVGALITANLCIIALLNRRRARKIVLMSTKMYHS